MRRRFATERCRGGPTAHTVPSGVAKSVLAKWMGKRPWGWLYQSFVRRHVCHILHRGCPRRSDGESQNGRREACLAHLEIKRRRASTRICDKISHETVNDRTALRDRQRPPKGYPRLHFGLIAQRNPGKKEKKKSGEWHEMVRHVGGAICAPRPGRTPQHGKGLPKQTDRKGSPPQDGLRDALPKKAWRRPQADRMQVRKLWRNRVTEP